MALTIQLFGYNSFFIVVLSMSGFVSSMIAYLSTMSVKDMAMRGFLSSMSGSLSSMSDSTKNGAIQLQWMDLTIQLIGYNSFFIVALAMSGFVSSMIAKDMAMSGSLSSMSDSTKNGPSNFSGWP